MRKKSAPKRKLALRSRISILITSTLFLGGITFMCYSSITALSKKTKVPQINMVGLPISFNGNKMTGKEQVKSKITYPSLTSAFYVSTNDKILYSYDFAKKHKTRISSEEISESIDENFLTSSTEKVVYWRDIDFFNLKEGEKIPRWNIYAFTKSGTTLIKQNVSPERDVISLSPDGKYFTYGTIVRQGGSGSFHYAIHLVDLSNSHEDIIPTSIIGTDTLRYPRWITNETLIFSRDDGWAVSNELYQYSLIDKQLHKFNPANLEEYDYLHFYGSFSPDGKWMTFCSPNPPTYNNLESCYLLNIKTKNKMELPFAFTESNTKFSLDSNFVASFSDKYVIVVNVPKMKVVKKEQYTQALKKIKIDEIDQDNYVMSSEGDIDGVKMISIYDSATSLNFSKKGTYAKYLGRYENNLIYDIDGEINTLNISDGSISVTAP